MSQNGEGIENRLVATESVEEALGICLFDENAMQLNPSKYIAIVFDNSHSDPKSVCENTVIPLEDDTDLLGVTVDRKSLNSTRKLSQRWSAGSTFKESEEDTSVRNTNEALPSIYCSSFQFLF